MKKLITALLALLVVTQLFCTTNEWVKNVTLGSYNFDLSTTTPFTSTKGFFNTTTNTAAYIATGTAYLNWSGSGSGNRGTKITNMTAAGERQDTVFYEFDWNPYSIAGQANSTGTSGIYPGEYSACLVRGSNDSIVFGLWFERWSLKAGSNFNSSTGSKALGDLHLMNLSSDVNNPVPARVITQTNPTTLVTWSYYTSTILPFAMLDQNFSTNNYAIKCDSINQSTDLGVSFKMCQWYHIKTILDFKNKRIVSFTIYQKDAPENTRTITDLPFVNNGANDVSQLEIGGPRGKTEGAASNGPNCNYTQYFDNFDIYTARQSAAANVTIKFQDGTGTELQTSKTVPNIEVGKWYKATESDKLKITFGGDYYLYDNTSVDSVLVTTTGGEIILKFNKATPTATKITASGPATSELYKDVTLNFAVKTTTDDIVSQGYFNVLVNGHVKNTITPDALGTGSISFPNLLVGTAQIKIVYVGDRIAYSNSDTATIAIEVAPSTSSVVPYPVYYDLGTMPEIMKFRLKNPTLVTRPASIAFANDSLKSLTLSTDTTTLTKTMYATWGTSALNATPDKVANYYSASDMLNIPYGNGARPSWMSFATPWLNKGGYNVYINQRTNIDLGTGMVTKVTMDDKSMYYPNGELNEFSIRKNGNNSGRRWNANGNDGLNQMAYLGSVNLETSGIHNLKFTCTSTAEGSGNQIAWVDMIQFIPIDQDSVTVNQSASTGLSKLYYPLFNASGFACYSTETFGQPGGEINLALPFQVTDPTTYDKKSYTLQHLDVTDPNLGLTGVDYVVIFKKDKWTRVAEGAVTTSDSTFICDLADGDYYYQEYRYSENSSVSGSIGTRTWIKDGYFTVGTGTDVVNTHASAIKTYTLGKTLTVKGIKSGAKVTVTDLTGRVVLNAIAGADVFTTTLKQGSIYIVKVISGNDTKTTKVIVQ